MFWEEKGTVCKTAKLWKKKLSFAGPKSVFRQSKAFLTFDTAFAANFFTAHLFQPFQFCSLWCNFLNPCAVSSVTFSTLLLLTVYSVTRSNFYNLTVQFLATLSGVQCVTLYLTQYCPFAVYLLRHFQRSFLPKSLLLQKNSFLCKVVNLFPKLQKRF